jgi:hypothetical protein
MTKKTEDRYWKLEGRVATLETKYPGYITAHQIETWSNTTLRVAYEALRDQYHKDKVDQDRLNAVTKVLQSRVTELERARRVGETALQWESIYFGKPPHPPEKYPCRHCGSPMFKGVDNAWLHDRNNARWCWLGEPEEDNDGE